MAPFFAAPPEVSQMAMPLRQSIKVATYLAEQKLRRREKFPLIVELEPLYACNLKCEGCGKIQHPAGVLKQRMPVAQAVGAVLESGAPMVSIAGGEPLMHPQIDEIVRQLLDRKKIVFLCTNAVLLPKHLHKFTPHKNFTWMVHIDVLDYLNDELGVDNMQISPGYAYEKAPDQEHFLGVEQTRELFAKAFDGGRRKKGRPNPSPLFLGSPGGKDD